MANSIAAKRTLPFYPYLADALSFSGNKFLSKKGLTCGFEGGNRLYLVLIICLFIKGKKYLFPGLSALQTREIRKIRGTFGSKTCTPDRQSPALLQCGMGLVGVQYLCALHILWFSEYFEELLQVKVEVLEKFCGEL